MSQPKAEFIKVASGVAGFQTMPVEEDKRLPESAIRVELCDENDAEKIAEGLYACFPTAFWDRKEPLEMRPPEHSTRVKRMTKRILPSLSHPNMFWVKAVLASSGEMIGVAGWMGPGNPVIHNHFARSAVDFYGWREKMGWSDEDLDEIWSGVSEEQWNGKIAKDDALRREVVGDEPHWYLAPLITWPEYQGRGVGKKLLNWAIEQADATVPVTPLYLESAPTAQAVYMHSGFVPQGPESNFLRRGPAVVRGLEAEDEKEKEKEKEKEPLDGKLDQVNVEVVAKEIEV